MFVTYDQKALVLFLTVTQSERALLYENVWNFSNFFMLFTPHSCSKFNFKRNISKIKGCNRVKQCRRYRQGSKQVLLHRYQR